MMVTGVTMDFDSFVIGGAGLGAPDDNEGRHSPLNPVAGVQRLQASGLHMLVGVATASTSAPTIQ